MQRTTRRAVVAGILVAAVAGTAVAVAATRRAPEVVAAGEQPGPDGTTPAAPATGPGTTGPGLTGPGTTAAGAPGPTGGAATVGGCAPGGGVPGPTTQVVGAVVAQVRGALVGCTEADATGRAQAAGWTVRVVRRDGEELMRTMDFRPDRLDLAVDAGTVTGLDAG